MSFPGSEFHNAIISGLSLPELYKLTRSLAQAGNGIARNRVPEQQVQLHRKAHNVIEAMLKTNRLSRNTLQRLGLSTKSFRNQVRSRYLKKLGHQYFRSNSRVSQNTFNSIVRKLESRNGQSIKSIMNNLHQDTIELDGHFVSKANIISNEIETALIRMYDILNMLNSRIIPAARHQGRIIDLYNFKQELILSFDKQFGTLTLNNLQNINPHIQQTHINIFKSLRRYRNVKPRSRRKRGLQPDCQKRK